MHPLGTPTAPASGPSRLARRTSLRIAVSTFPLYDIVLVAIIIVVAEAEIWLPPGACIGGQFPFGLCNFGESLSPPAVAVIYTSVAALAFLYRRRRPLQVLVVVAGLSVLVAVIWVGSPGLGYFLPMLVAAYSVGRYHRGEHPWLTLLVAGLVVIVTSVIHDLRVPGQSPNGSLATFYLILIGAIPMGRALQTRDLRAELAAAEAREARLAKDETARRAVEEERARIARELHDVAAHGASLIVVQSVAAQGVFDSDTERARSALESIESEAREMLGEMRRLLPGIRTSPADEGSTHPAPETIEKLVARVRAAGQPIDAQIECPGPLDERLERTIYRCLQEALTNAVKHARGAPTTVLVRCGDDTVEIAVENGPATPHVATSPGGRGLIGMRERVGLVGGSLTAEPTVSGGFVVRVTIPKPKDP